MSYFQKFMGVRTPKEPTQADFAARQRQAADHAVYLDQILPEVDSSGRCPYASCKKKLPHLYPPKDKCGACGREFLVPEGFRLTPSTENGGRRRSRQY